MGVRIKICGLTTTSDVEAACMLGVDAIGFVLEPSSPRFVGSYENLNELCWAAAPFVTTVSVFARPIFDETLVSPTMLDQATEYSNFRRPASNCILARRVKPGQSPESVVEGSESFGALMLDAFVEGVHGGTGKILDWDLAGRIVELSPRPVILAGGLTPDNVAEAIERVQPAGVDVSSGVEASPGRKDFVKMRDFVRAVREG